MVRITDHLDMTIDDDWDVKPQHNNRKYTEPKSTLK